MSSNLFTSYLDSSKTAAAAAEQIREAIACTVIANTAHEKRVDEEYYQILKDEAATFAKSTRIVFVVDDTRKVSDFCFHGNEMQILSALQRLMAKVAETACFYADRDSVTVKGDTFVGFCWPHDGVKYFCGYPKPQESQPDDWDYEESQAVVPAKKGTSRK